MSKLAGLVILIAVLIFLNTTASAQEGISVVGDRISIEEDNGIFSIVWTGTVFFFKPSVEPVTITVHFELSPSGAWQERGTGSTTYVGSREVGARSVRERIVIATTEAPAGTDPVSLFDKNQMLRLRFAVRRPGETGAAASLAQADYQLPALGYVLLNSARRGNVHQVAQLLEAGVAADSASIDNFTPLMAAAAAGHVDVVKLLLEKGATTRIRTKGAPFVESPFGSRTPGGWNALMAGVSSGNPEIVQLLLAKGAKANSAMEDRRTPLLIAARGGSPEVVRLLLDRGANVNVVSDSGYSPLAMADINGRGAIARILVSRGGRIIVPWDILSGSD